ncbi:MFS transporter [Amorphus sp. 3PC139-8]|uniref:MFS transporter n=1 Tax=Amorphus sp. 3PC139-8 TaxID=2735676 RepID=UPI00345C8449
MAYSTAQAEPSTASWPAVLSVSFAMFSLVTAELLPISLLTPIAADLNISIGAAGQAVTVTATTAALASPLVILGSGRFDRRLLVWSLAAVLAVSCVISAVAGGLWQFLIGRVLLGLALGGTWALVTALALRLVPTHQVARAMSMILTGVSAASVVAPSAGAYLGEIVGWRGTFFAAAVLGLAALIAQVATLPRLPAAQALKLASFRTVVARGSVVAGLATIFLVLSGQFASFTYIRPILEQLSRLEIDSISLALFAFGISGVVGSIVGGALAARSAFLCAAGSSVFLMLATTSLALVVSAPFVAIAATAIWGFAFGAFSVAIATWNAEAAPDHAESVGALQASSFQISIAVGAIIGGATVEVFGPVGAIVYTCLAVLLGAAVMLTTGIRSRSRKMIDAIAQS